jgi:hypothetical protein
MKSAIEKSSSLVSLLTFWWVLFVIIQTTQRLFLLPETAVLERPTPGLLARTFGNGLLADMTSATGAVAVAAVLGTLVAITAARLRKSGMKGYGPALNLASTVVGSLLLVVLIVDVGYYGYSQQHLNFVFFEYLDDLLHTSGNETGASQAAEQTAAELDESGKWGLRIGSFLLLEGLAIAGWWLAFKQKIGPMLARRHTLSPMMSVIVVGAAGLVPMGLSWSQGADTDNDAYFNLAQNPVLFSTEPLRDAFLSQWSWAPRRMPGSMSLEEAVQMAQETHGRGARFPFPQYPLVEETNEHFDALFDGPVNVVLIFVEGLDRRFLGRTIDPSSGGFVERSNAADSKPSPDPRTPSNQAIRLTPFLDRLKDESLYFENFFSNGVATTRGLFSTFCSSYPRQGTAALKTRYDRDYLCLPSLLRKGGFTTEMVISLDSDLPGIRPFMARNGLDRLYGEGDFPADAERLGVGLTDGALFDFMRTRIEALQDRRTPFFLAALTSGMHHPFTIPKRHPDVLALQQHRDGYVPALRYFDVEFEAFFTSLRRDGLLRNSMVIILGDHGRHEPVGATDVERQAGRFFVPLFMWLDDSLRASGRFRPRHVQSIASQVDLAPTILRLNGMVPRVAPFVGRDLSCLFTDDCLHDNVAYLSSVYDDLIGLADRKGLWLYSFRRRSLLQVDLNLHGPVNHPSISDPDAAARYRRMRALYLASNVLLEQNRIWSWRDLNTRL